MALNNEDKEIIKEIAKDNTINALVEHFGGKYKREEIKSFIHYNNLDFIRKECGKKRIYNVNDNFFNLPLNRYNATILGFWWADGYITKDRNNYIISFDQHYKDSYYLEKILKLMDSNYPLYIRGENKKIKISSKKLYDKLIELGGTPNKSLIAIFPNWAKDLNIFPYFLRGLFDGDGSISKGKNSNYYIVNITGTFELLNEIKISLEEKFDINKVRIGKDNRSKNTWQLVIGNAEDVSKFGNIIYGNLDLKNDLYLIRKYEKFLDHIRVMKERNYYENKSKRLTIEDGNKIRELRQNGMKVKDIAELYGIDSSYCSKICNNKKLKNKNI